MKRVAIPLLAGVLVWVGCVSTSGPADDQTQILRLDAEWSRAAQALDIDRVLSFWSDDAIVFPPGSPALVGKPAIRQYVQKSFRTPGFGISWETTSVVLAGSHDLAYATGTNRVTFAGPDGKEIIVQGKAVTVWRREKAGWKCAIDIWNDVPPPSQ